MTLGCGLELVQVLWHISHAKNMEVLQTTFIYVGQPVISIGISGDEEEAFFQNKIPCIADDPFDHLPIVKNRSSPTALERLAHSHESEGLCDEDLP